MKRGISLFLAIVMGVLLILPFTKTPFDVSVNAANEEYLTFTLNEDGESYSVGCSNKEISGDIVIPSTYNGLPVTTIRSAGFINCKALASVIIPDSVTDIDDYAFMYCDNLERVNIPDGVTHIGQQAFRDCVKITEFSIPEVVNDIEIMAFYNTGYYNNKNNWSNNALYIDNCLIRVDYTLVGEHNIIDGTRIIAEAAFDSCKKITTVTIPDSVIAIGERAFIGCEALSSIEILARISCIRDLTFYGCSSLVTVELPDYIENIGTNAFGSCTSLNQVILPDSLETIGNVAFSHCKNLKVIYMANDVTEIGACAFGGSGLETVYYAGTNSQWSQISILEENEPLLNADKIFADTKPQTPKTLSKNAVGGVEVYWEPVLGAVKYNVYRRAAGQSNWTLVGTTTGTTIVDRNVTSGVYYRYSVRAYNAYGIYSDYVYNLTSLRKYMATPALTGISNSTNGIYIKWNPISGVTNGYRVYRRGAGQTTWTYLGTTKNTYWTDSGVKNASGGYYRYTVIADGGYHSAFDTNGLYLKRLSNPTLKSATSSSSGITLKWNTVKDATGYYVYRKTGNGNWVRIAVVTPGSTSTYLDKTAQKGVTYTYTVRAVCGKYISYFDSGIKVTDKY